MCLVSNGCTNHTSCFTDSQHCLFSMFYFGATLSINARCKPELSTSWKTSGQCNKHVAKTTMPHTTTKKQPIHWPTAWQSQNHGIRMHIFGSIIPYDKCANYCEYVFTLIFVSHCCKRSNIQLIAILDH